MAATELGTTGVWGINADESGMLISDISYDYSQKDRPVLSKIGEVIGVALWQQKCDIKFSGLIPDSAPFASKLGAVLTIANTIPDHMASSGGKTVLMGLSRKAAQEDFQQVDVSAVNWPLMAA
jgi:hypothetical protein